VVNVIDPGRPGAVGPGRTTILGDGAAVFTPGRCGLVGRAAEERFAGVGRVATGFTSLGC
jgi:hypothetical protein